MHSKLMALVLLMASFFTARAQAPEAEERPAGHFAVSAYGNGSTGDFAPYMIGSWTHGKHPMKSSLLFDADLARDIDRSKRFSWGLRAELISGYSATADYDRWREKNQIWIVNSLGPSNVWAQQLYAEAKYRSVLFTLGAKERGSALLNNSLSSGDLVQSGNSRPIPELRVGFIDFQDIPFLRGWVQIQGEISYGIMTDNHYLKRHFNYYTGHINTGAWYSYKRCYFRAKPAKRLSVTVGMQVGAFFGGRTQWYKGGTLENEMRFSESLKTFFKMFLPIGENGEDYYVGQSLGSWDFVARYRLKNDSEVRAYFQWPWENGSSIGRRNRVDGLWGLEYRSGKRGLISGVVIEYIDFRDQCGPIHWAPANSPGTSVTVSSSGRDDYYNNYYYNSYANYGMAIGTPFLLSPIYNRDGNLSFASNRANGFHLGVMGSASKTVDYRLLASYQRGLGTYLVPYYQTRTCISMMAEAQWDAAKWLKGLRFTAQAAFDAGKLRGNNFGASLAVAYTGLIK